MANHSAIIININKSKICKITKQPKYQSSYILPLTFKLCFVSIIIFVLRTVDGKNIAGTNDVETIHGNFLHKKRVQRDFVTHDLNSHQQCKDVKGYFEAIDIRFDDNSNGKGSICGGNCCSNSTEIELRYKARNELESFLHHHTKRLRGSLESTVEQFENHILELSEQSENKTLTVFSRVYPRMVPLSKKLIHQLYTEIISNLKITNMNEINASNNNNNNNNVIKLDDAIQQFFVNLFPVAYHQAVQKNDNNYGELHEDYINCLKHTFDDLQPFGAIPKQIKKNLMQSVQTAQIFMISIIQSAKVLNEIEELYPSFVTTTCEKQLLKMRYCPSCNGLERTQVKTCYSYCLNVMRGCSAQYAGILDSPWSSVVDGVGNLVQSHIRSDNGIVTTIKQLDVKLSEAIMFAMENGPQLETKVKKTCGLPKLLVAASSRIETLPTQPQNIKWANPFDTELLRFLSTIDKSKDFYAKIVENLCDDEDEEKINNHCWTGERIGDYTQTVMPPGYDGQRYNPEVPFEPNPQANKLNDLVDKLLKIRKNIGSATPSTRNHWDIQSDMARHDDIEGSGQTSDDIDDEEYGNIHGSGDGSGDGSTSPTYEITRRTEIESNDIEQRSSAPLSLPSSSLCLATLFSTLVTIIFLTKIKIS